MVFKFNPFTNNLDDVGDGSPSLGDVESLTGNIGGTVFPDGAGNINVVGLSQRTESTTSSNDGGGILISGDPGTNTLTASYESFGSLNVFIAEAAGNNNLTGSANVGIGPFALNSLTTGSNNIAFGYIAMQPSQDASNNIAIGPLALNVCISGNSNVAIGSASLQSLGNSGQPTNFNTALGASTFQTLIQGTNNIGIGYQAGSNYQDAESFNILIGSAGLPGESNICRIGNSISEGGVEIFELWTNATVSIGNNTLDPSGFVQSLLVGGNNIASNGCNQSAGVGNGNLLQAAQYSLVIGSSSTISGTTAGLCQGVGNQIGTGAQQVIIGAANCTIDHGANFSGILVGFECDLSGASNNSVILNGNTISLDGSGSINGLTCNLTGNNSVALGRGTLTGDESFFFSDQQSAYSIATTQVFTLRFTNGCDLNTFLVNIDGSTTQTAAQFIHVTSVITTPYVVLDTDYYLSCNPTTAGAPIDLTFPTATGSGRKIIIKDVSGDAAANPITATSAGGTFDGVGSVVINTNFGAIECTDISVNLWSLS